MGLLDNFSEFIKTPEGMGLLSAVAGGLAGANRGTPINNLGRAGLAGVMGYGNALDRQERTTENAVQSQLRQAQMAEFARKQNIAEAQQAWLQNANAPEEVKAGVVPFEKWWERQNPKVEPYTLTPGSKRYGVDNTVVAEVPTEAKKTAIEQMLDSAGITDQGMRQKFILQGLQKSVTHAPAPSAVVNMKQETEEAKAVGKSFGETYTELMKADINAPGKIARFDRLGQLLEGVNTGKLTPMGTEVAALAKSLGLDIDANLGNKQAADALANEMSLQLRNPSGGAGMPGALSDKDREFLVKMTPGLSKDPQANKLIIETAKKLAQRERDVAKLARNYRKKRGTLDEGFFDELATFSDANPLFPAGGGSAPSVGEVKNGYKFKGGNPADRNSWEKI